jgi:fructosamine-3-kinase
MSTFSQRVAQLTGVEHGRLQRLAGGDLSEVLLVPRQDDRPVVAKGGPAVATEAGMLRSLLAAGVPAPMVEAEHDGILLLEYLPNDEVFSPAAWRDIGEQVRRLHSNRGSSYGWPTDHRIGTIELDNGETLDWPRFWGEQRLAATAALLDRPWRLRIEGMLGHLPELLPASPPPAHLHGDLWTGNILVSGGKLVGLIDPACYFGHSEVDLAMLSLFGAPPVDFWEAYGEPEPGWERRRAVYQLFPALVHLRLFGGAYGSLVERLLNAVERP